MPAGTIFRVVWLTTCLWAPAVAKDSCPAIPKRAKGLQQWAVKHAEGVFEQLKADVKAVEAAVAQHGAITIGATGRLEVSDRVLVHVLACADLGFVVRQGLSQPDRMRRHLCGQDVLHFTSSEPRDPRSVAECVSSAQHPRLVPQQDGCAEAR